MPTPTIPGKNTTLIVDVSSDEVNANFVAAKAAGVGAVLIKATEGATYQDPGFITLYDNAKSAGLRIGVYHFGTARDPQDQVNNFVKTVTRVAGGFANIVAALDLEHNDPSPDNTISADQGDEWVRIFKRQTGRSPLLYAGGYLKDNGGARNRPNLAACPLWLADYEKTATPILGCQPWSIWQFTDGTLGPYPGTVSGIGRCDQDVFVGGGAELDLFWETYGASP